MLLLSFLRCWNWVGLLVSSLLWKHVWYHNSNSPRWRHFYSFTGRSLCLKCIVSSADLLLITRGKRARAVGCVFWESLGYPWPTNQKRVSHEVCYIIFALCWGSTWVCLLEWYWLHTGDLGVHPLICLLPLNRLRGIGHRSSVNVE